MEDHAYELLPQNQVTEKEIYGTYQSNRALFEQDYNHLISSNEHNNIAIATNDWQMTMSGFIAPPVEQVIRYNFTETSSDGTS